MKLRLFLACFCLTFMGFSQGTNYELVWSDEFDGNGAINTDKWFHQTLLPNGQSWYNGEIQHYTDRIDNSYVSNGTLKIVAKKETFTDQGVTKEYTSARLNSKFAFTYGRVEVRAKLPFGVGTWPAIWTLGQNIIEPGGYWTDTYGTIGWPACGELDIMEHWGNNQDFIQSATHTPSSHGNTVNKGGRIVTDVSNTFHIYAMEWDSEKVVFSVDDIVHYTYEPSVQNPDTWPFDENQYLLLNVAILPEIDPVFTESEMEIDYVRVYQESILSNETSDIGLADIEFASPSRDSLQIKIPEEKIGTTVTIYSPNGKFVATYTLYDELTTLDLSSKASGLYMLKIVTKEGTFYKKAIKN